MPLRLALPLRRATLPGGGADAATDWPDTKRCVSPGLREGCSLGAVRVIQSPLDDSSTAGQPLLIMLDKPLHSMDEVDDPSQPPKAPVHHKRTESSSPRELRRGFGSNGRFHCPSEWQDLAFNGLNSQDFRSFSRSAERTDGSPRLAGGGGGTGIEPSLRALS